MEIFRSGVPAGSLDIWSTDLQPEHDYCGETGTGRIAFYQGSIRIDSDGMGDGVAVSVAVSVGDGVAEGTGVGDAAGVAVGGSTDSATMASGVGPVSSLGS